MNHINYARRSNSISSKKIRSNKRKNFNGNNGYVKYIVLFLVLAVFFGIFFAFRSNIGSLFNPVTIASTITRADLKEADGRTNILVLGADRRDTESNVFLTDTILVASIGRVEGNAVLISLPRDLWVETPSGYRSKINAVYANGGPNELMQVVEDVLGLPIHYYGVVDFKIFEDSIDILGGIDVNVENSFTDYYYPIAGKENAPLNERYETISFEQGLQTMNGETALKYVRSRKGDNNEGTDFARSKRQQNVISAIKDKVVSLDTLLDISKIKELYDTYSTNVDTDIDFITLQQFYLLSQQVDIAGIKSVVLDDRSAAEEGGLLYAPQDTELYGGAYVLVPKSGDYSQMHAYVQRFLFGE